MDNTIEITDKDDANLCSKNVVNIEEKCEIDITKEHIAKRTESYWFNS